MKGGEKRCADVITDDLVTVDAADVVGVEAVSLRAVLAKGCDANAMQKAIYANTRRSRVKQKAHKGTIERCNTVPLWAMPTM